MYVLVTACMPPGLLQLSPLQLKKELAVHGATLPYPCPAIVVTFSTIVAYQKSRRNTHKYRIQTDARVITGNTTEIKNRGRRPRFFISRLYFP